MRSQRFSAGLLSLALLASACATPPETVVANADPTGWKVGNALDLGRGKGTIVEWIPEGEEIDAWSEMVTIQFMGDSPLSSSVAMVALRGQMKERCPGVMWKVLAQDRRTVTYEWAIRSCEGQEDQHEVARLLQGHDGLHRIAFTSKGPEMDPEDREKWLEIFAEAYVAKGGRENRIVWDDES